MKIMHIGLRGSSHTRFHLYYGVSGRVFPAKLGWIRCSVRSVAGNEQVPITKSPYALALVA